MVRSSLNTSEPHEDFMSVSWKEPKPENVLKTKDRNTAFSPAKPENTLKTSQLQKLQER